MKIMVRDPKMQNTEEMLLAASRGDLDTVKSLLSQGRDINAYLSDGYFSGFTALMHAAKNGRLECVKHLIECDADIDPPMEIKTTVSSQFKPAIILAAEGGHTDVVKLLIENGANIELFDDEGKTALSVACQRYYETSFDCYKDIIELLIKSNANINHQDQRGISSIMRLIGKNLQDIEVLKILIDAGADIYIEDEHEFNTIDYSSLSNNDLVAQYINSVKDLNDLKAIVKDNDLNDQHMLLI